MTFDGQQFLQDFNVPTNTKDQHRGWIHIKCPFCVSDGKGKMGFSLMSGTFRCHKCGSHRTVELIEKLLRVPTAEAGGIFRHYLKAAAGRYEKRQATGLKIDLPSPNFTIKGEREYMKRRGIWDPYILERYDLRGGGMFGKWAYRIVVPIKFQGRIVSATGRDWTGQQEIPYLTLGMEEQIVDMKTIFLGLDDVPENEVAVVEGPFDAIRGGPGFLASFGAAFTPDQLFLLASFKTVHFILDNDDTGRKANHKYAAHLDALGVDVDIITWEGKEKDTGEFAPEYIQDLRKELGFVS